MTQRTHATTAWIVALAGALAARGVLGAAQQPTSQTPPAFRAATDLVEVDVVVQNRNGEFVTDLALEDFEVQEEAKPQQIQQFYLHLVDDQRKPLARPEGTLAASALPASSPRIFVVVFDNEHLTPAGFKRTQDAAIRLFSQQFLNGDVGGVVVNRQMVNNRLTSDREELLRAVRNAKPDIKSAAAALDRRLWPRMSDIEAVRIIVNDDRTVREAVIQRACADDPNACAKIDPYLEIRTKAAELVDRVRTQGAGTLETLRTLLAGLGRLDGRKAILLLTEGFMAEETWPLVQEAVGLAAQANARIYTLDARGLDRGMADRLGGTNPGVDDAQSRLLEQFDLGSDSINSLAVDTGGFVVRNTNIFDKAIARIAADAGNYYILGYRPLTALDGKFHKISVNVKRPNLVVRARRGYVATPRPVPAKPRLVDSTATLDATASPEPTRGSTDSPRADTVAPDSLAASSDTSAGSQAESIAGPGAIEGRSGSSTPNMRLRPDALKHTETLVNNGPASAAATTGWEAYQRGDLESARSALAVAAAGATARPWVHYALGQANYGLRDYANAIIAWERVRTTTPEFEPVYFDLVDGYLQQKEYDKAVRVMRDAQNRWPRDPEIFEALGVAQVWRNAIDDAIGSFEQAIALSPGDGVGYFNLGKAFELRYRASRRYVQQLRSWVANETDRKKAAASYERYLSIGGPFASAAREGLTRLEPVDKR